MTIKAAVLSGVLALSAVTGVAQADPWVDYAPSNQPWTVASVRVEGGHLDDYLVSLKKSWADQLDIEKKTGDVLDWHILVNTNPSASGATVVFLVKLKDWSELAPNKERSLKLQEEFRKSFTKDAQTKMADDRSKFRVFLDEGTYEDITYLK